MKCFRCGYCCTKLLAVIIINPEAEDVFPESNCRGINQLEERCPHLRGDKPGEYLCAVHHYRWFEETPCGQYQNHWGEHPCRMGNFLINGVGLPKRREE